MPLKTLSRVQYFNGPWFDDWQEKQEVRLALLALWDGVLRCREELITDSANFADALQTVRENIHRRELVDAFLRTFELPDPRLRFQEAKLAYQRIVKCLGEMG